MLPAIKNNIIIKYVYSWFPPSYRKGYSYYHYIRNLLKTTENYSHNEFNDFQLNKLKNIVNYAWENVIGYRTLWDSHNFHPEKLKSLGDINLIPIVDKKILRNNISAFTNKNIKNISFKTTGGTTGVPFGYYQEYRNTFIEKAFIHDLWSKKVPNISLKTKSTVLRGKKLNNIITYDPMIGLILSSYDITLNNVKKYITAIEKYKTPLLLAYPSSLFLLANFVKDHKININHKFKCIMLGSENLYDFQKTIIKDVFQTEISHWYGQGEKVAFAGNCENNDDFHVYPQYGITEILNNDGNPVNKGEVGQIIGTGFWNFATPFIRYKTSDFAQLGDDNCSYCSLNYKLLKKIEGRLQEFIVGKSHKLIALTGITVVCGKLDDIMQFQFHQDTVGKIRFEYVKKGNVAKVNEKNIYNELKQKLNDEFDIEIKEVSYINGTNQGKMCYLNQKLDVNRYLKNIGSN